MGSRSRRLFWLAVLAVCLSLPLATHEFNFGFGDGDGGAAEEDGNGNGNGADAAQANKADVDALAVGRKLVARRAASDRKFKFHKLERVYVDDYVEDAEDENTSAGAEEQDQEDAEEEEREKQEESDRRRRKAKAAAKSTKKRSNDDQSASQQGEDDNGPSLLSRLMAGLFGSDDVAEPEPEAPSNSLINWLQWLSERAGGVGLGSAAKRKQEREAAQAAAQSASWLSYLNRWPFNSLFPFSSQVAKPKTSPRTHVGDSTEQQQQQQQQLPMSQEYFELLMHSLPAFVVNASHVEHGECRQQLQVMQRQLRAHKLWTLQMLDATGKISAGLLRGNINQLGDFDLCAQVRAVVKVTPEQPVRIRGKYCLAHIETQTKAAGLKLPLHLAQGRGLFNGHLSDPRHFLPRYSVANWGVCVPHACSARVVQEMLQTNLRPYNDTAVEFHIQVEDEDCSVRQRRSFVRLMRKDSKLSMSVLAIAALVSTCLLACLWEQWSFFSAQLLRLRKWQAARRPPEAAAPPAEESTAEQEESTEAAAEPIDSIDQEAAPADPAPIITATPNPIQKYLLQLLAQLLAAFSPQRTWQSLSSVERPDMEFPLFHLLKLLASFGLYLSLKYLMAGHLPLTNRDSLVEAMAQPWSVLFRSPLLYSDALLLMSGFVATSQLSLEMEQKSHIQLLRNVANKASRYLPTVCLVLCFQIWILPKLGAAPLWQALVGENARLCGQQMWRSVFSLQNAIDFEEACSPLTLQLALDVQLYLLAPLIVWLYHTDAEAGFFFYGAFHAVSVAMRYSRTQRELLTSTLFHGIHVSKFYRSANLLYTSPLSRATPYLLGIGAGLLYRREKGSLSVSPRLLPYGWALAGLSLVWCFWSAAAGMRSDFVYASGDAAAYAAWSPLVLGLAICWCVFMFPREANSKLRSLCLARPVLLLSRIAFPLQLAIYVVVLWRTASVKEAIRFQVSDLFDLSELALILCLAMALAFVVDVPAQQLRRQLIDRIFIERAPSLSTEPSEGDASEALTSETPEPAETIWASDPEEEEQKYIQRRRSSVPETEPETGPTADEPAKAAAESEAEEDEEEAEDDA